ncbi:unnamed protein product [Gordionus sp. m RMFG-2023]
MIHSYKRSTPFLFFGSKNDATSSTPPIINITKNPLNSINDHIRSQENLAIAASSINIFNTDEWHMKLWEKSDTYAKKLIRESFRDYFTGRNSLEIRRLIYSKLPPIKPGEIRDECNPYFSGVDFCGFNGDCEDLTPKLSPDLTKENPEISLFKCQCYSGWEGQFCEKDANECKSLTCENGAICYNLLPPEKYRCTCKPYSYGKNCEKVYPRGDPGFLCHSSENSSLISWVPEIKFKIWDYYPYGFRKSRPNSEDIRLQELKKMVELNQLIIQGQTLGSVANKWLMNRATKLYLNHDKEKIYGDEILRPNFWIRYENNLGWNFNADKLRKLRVKTRVPEFDHVMEIEFPKVVLIKAFVSRGGYEKSSQCVSCKRLVTKYKIKMRTGSRKWFKFTDKNGDELIYNAMDPGERLENLEDLKNLDVQRPRLRYPPAPFTAEALRIHVIDWWPREARLHLRPGDNLDVNHFYDEGIRSIENYNNSSDYFDDSPRGGDKNIKRMKNKRVEPQNPVLRFDVLGCHI